MAYKYHKKLTIDHTKVAAALTDYPFLFNTTDGNLKTVANGGHIENTASGGTSGSLIVPADLVFAPNPDGSSKYDFEFEKYDPTTGELIAHVRIPSVSPSVDTVFYLVYGDSSITASQENIIGVWGSDFRGVWHLRESAAPYRDSTQYGNHSSAGTYPTQVDGKIGKAQDFEKDSNQEIQVPDSTNLRITGTLTCEAWVNPESLSGVNNLLGICTKRQWGPYAGYTFYLGPYATNENKILFAFYDGGDRNYIGNTSIGTGSWRYVAFTYSDPANVVNFYLDGQPDGSPTCDRVLGASTYTFRIGGFPFFDGIIDELRVSSVVRPAGYFATTFNNHSSPATFYALGSEVSLLARPYSFIM